MARAPGGYKRFILFKRGGGGRVGVGRNRIDPNVP